MERGHVEAQEYLGVMYFYGEGVEKDKALALKCFEKGIVKTA